MNTKILQLLIALLFTSAGLKAQTWDERPVTSFNTTFEQDFTTKEKGGLGLSIVKRIIEAHGWKIQLESLEPATIQIMIPSKDIRYE